MNRSSQLISAIMTLALGILCLVLKGSVIGIAVTVLGVILLVLAVVDLVNKYITAGVIKAVLGIAVLVIGWIFIEIAIFVIAIILLLYGVLELIKRIFAKKNGMKLWAIIISFIEPVICIAAGALLLTNAGTTIEWTIIVAGIFLVIDAVLSLIAALAPRK